MKPLKLNVGDRRRSNRRTYDLLRFQEGGY
jgi:hypothetical protein